MTADELAIFDHAGRLYTAYIAQYAHPTSQTKATLLYKCGEEALTLYRHIQSLDIHGSAKNGIVVYANHAMDNFRNMSDETLLEIMDKHHGRLKAVKKELGVSTQTILRRVIAIDPNFRQRWPAVVGRPNLQVMAKAAGAR